MLLDHHHVDCFGVLECQEAEASGSARRAISHDCALYHLAKL